MSGIFVIKQLTKIKKKQLTKNCNNSLINIAAISTNGSETDDLFFYFGEHLDLG